MTMAIGIIETRSIAVTAELLNQILSLNKVKLINVEYPGNGIVTVFLSGEYSQMKNALSVSEKISTGFQTSFNYRLITKPDDKLYQLLGLGKMKSVKPAIPPEQKEEKQKITIDEDRNVRAAKVIESKEAESKISISEKDAAIVQPIKSFAKGIRIEPRTAKPRTVKDEKPVIVNGSSDIPLKVRLDNPTIAKLRKEALGKKKDVEPKKEATLSTVIQNGNGSLSIEQLEELNVHKLRRYARNFADFPIKGREISRANRDELLNYFKEVI